MLAFLGGLGVLSGAGGEKAGSSRPEAESITVMTEGALITDFGFEPKEVVVGKNINCRKELWVESGNKRLPVLALGAKQ